MNGLLGDDNYNNNGLNWGDVKIPRIPPELAFRQAMANLNSSVDMAGAVGAPSGSTAAQMWASQAAAQQAIANQDPYQQYLNYRKDMLSGDKDKAAIDYTKAQTVTEGYRPDYLKAQIAHENAASDYTRAQTNTEAYRPAQVQAATDASLAGAEQSRAQTANEPLRGDQMRSDTNRSNQLTSHDQQTMEYEKQKQELENAQRARNSLVYRGAAGGANPAVATPRVADPAVAAPRPGDPAVVQPRPADPALNTTDTAKRKAFLSLPGQLQSVIQNEVDPRKQDELLVKFASKDGKVMTYKGNDGVEHSYWQPENGQDAIPLEKAPIPQPGVTNQYAQGPMNESQAKAAKNAQAMARAHEDMNRLEAAAISRWDKAKGNLDPFNAMTSEERQQYNMAQSQFINTHMHAVTGAGARPDEEKPELRFIPQAGDGPDTLRRKAEERAAAVEDEMMAAGGGYRPQGPWADGTKEDHARIGKADDNKPAVIGNFVQYGKRKYKYLGPGQYEVVE